MNEIERVSVGIRAQLPSVSATLDPPNERRSAWFLDLDYNGRHATIEWRPRNGFGISSRPNVGFGEGVDEILPEGEQVIQRIIALLSNDPTS